MECEFPTINSNTQEIAEIFKTCKTIAVIGMSPDEEKPSFFVPHYMIEQGYEIFPVHPKADEILGRKVYRSLEEIPVAIDCVNVFRKPDACLDIAKAAVRKGGVKALWLQKDIVNNAACELAVAHGMKAVQNHCMMVEHKKYKGVK